LEVLLVDHRGRGLAGDAQDRHGVAGRGVQAGDHVGAGGAGGADADTDVAGPGAGVALGHVRGALHMAGKGVGDAAGCLERRVEGVDRRAGNTERVGDALALEDLNCRAGSGHSSHGVLLLRPSDSLSRRAPRSAPPVGTCSTSAFFPSCGNLLLLSGMNVGRPDEARQENEGAGTGRMRPPPGGPARAGGRRWPQVADRRAAEGGRWGPRGAGPGGRSGNGVAMSEYLTVRCPVCRRAPRSTLPSYPCACGAPVAPPLDRHRPAVPVAHRAWQEEWVTVRCAACGLPGEWPRPELGCPCGTSLRIPVAEDRTAAAPDG